MERGLAGKSKLDEYLLEDEMKLEITNPSDDLRWDEYVKNHSLGSIFHHSAWKEVIEKTFSHVRPMYCVVENPKKNILGCVPLFFVKSWLTGGRLVSLPFSLFCDPLVDSMDVFDVLVEGILDKQKELNASFIEMRTRTNGKYFGNTDFKAFSGFKNHTLSLQPDLETMKKSFHRSCVRQHINRAEQSNLSVREASSVEDVRIFYELNCMTRKKFGVPPKPFKFYKNMWDILSPKNMLGILIAFYENQPVCSILYLKFKQSVHAEYMGTNDAFIKYNPNILLFWKAIQKAKEEGYHSFDFGSSSSSNSRLIQFKRRWGTVEEDLTHHYFPGIKGVSAGFENSKKYKILTYISHKMPDGLFKMTGQLLYNHLGG